MPIVKCFFALIFLVVASTAYGNTADEVESSPEESSDSPWLITPLLSSDPKISTAAGALAGYVHTFDDKSPASMAGIAGTYSTTQSWYLSLFAKLYFGEDKHRLLAAAAHGEIRNDYSDFLGSGLDAQTTDDLNLYVLRYAYRLFGRWYLGPQFVSTNYAILGDNLTSIDVLKQFGLTGFQSNALGLYAQYDSRDNQYSPSKGQVFEAHNFAYREELGGDVSFDALTADYQYYLPQGESNVVAFHVKGRWTNDAPSSGYSSVDLRGYVRGQYLAEHMTTAEVDYRYSLSEKLGLAVFGGVAGLYGSGTEEDSNELFPAGGIGAFYQLNDEGMVVRADIAMGKEGNWGFYLTFGHGFEK
ncbi:MAG: BamA/TamA family outer membrane protein [Desulfobulbia bacterium]